MGPSFSSGEFERSAGLPQQERVNIAVFIDFDNIEIGVKNTMGASFDAGLVLVVL